MYKALLAIVVSFALLLSQSTTVSANHSWGSYHWARTSNPFTLQLGDNLTSNWDTHLSTASGDWSTSSVLDTVIVAGQGGKTCKATTGRVEVCNKTYGRNGWLGIAQIYLSGEHITKGITKMNDTYFSTSYYNTAAWRQLVMCQEVGHTFGLDHQDENHDNPNLGTCMDYTSNPESNQHPNAHDYAQLESIYTHLDSMTTVSQSLSLVGKNQNVDPGDDASSWGQLVRKNGRAAVYERDLGHGDRLLTHVFYAE